jgi:hypothetical protein
LSTTIAFTVWGNAISSRTAMALVAGAAQAELLLHFPDDVEQAIAAVLLGVHVLERSGDLPLRIRLTPNGGVGPSSRTKLDFAD